MSETWRRREPAEIRKSFEELTRSLRKAESSLLLPQPISATQIYSTEQKVVANAVVGHLVVAVLMPGVNIAYTFKVSP